MCLAKVYVRTDTAEELVMENVTHVVVNDGRVLLTSLFMETEELQGRITSVDFTPAKLVLESA
jgi:predicted RNA-binding protein